MSTARLEHLRARAAAAEADLRRFLDGEIAAADDDLGAARVRAYRLGRSDTLSIVQSWIRAELNAAALEAEAVLEAGRDERALLAVPR